MSAIVYKVHRKSGDYIRGAIVPPHHSRQAHFGVVDGVIVTFLLLCLGGLLCVAILH